MAAALFAARSEKAGSPLEVASAGIAALVGRPPPMEAIELMAERGMDISRHRAQQVTEAMARRHDLVLVMETAQQFYLEQNWPVLRGRVRRLAERQGKEVLDPYGRSRKVFLKSLSQIETGVEDWSGLFQ